MIVEKIRHPVASCAEVSEKADIIQRAALPTTLSHLLFGLSFLTG